MRNPLESWEKSDSEPIEKLLWGKKEIPEGYREVEPGYYLGPNDQTLAMKLRKAGTDHRKFMRMIAVYVDITAPLYWWKEFDTYKVGTVANSCSTMHKIHAKEFTLEDFSCECLFNDDYDGNNDRRFLDIFNQTIDGLNEARASYLETKDKKYWWQMIQLLPSSYNQRRTVMLNYEVLANIYKSRKNHKLDEWHEFCDWIKTLPYSELIVGTPSRKRDTFADALEEYMANHEEHPLPSMNEIDELFINVMNVDRRVKSYRVHDKTGMKKILDFYDANHKSLYAVDLYRTTLDEALALIKEELVKLTRQNLELGA